MKKHSLLLTFALTLTLLAGCSAPATSAPKSAENATGATAPSAVPAPRPEESVFDGGGTYTVATVKKEAKLILRAGIAMESTDFDAAVAALNKLVGEVGGYYEQNSLQQGTYYDTHAARFGDFTIRLPSEKFDAFLTAAGDVGHVVTSSRSSEDVGESYYDTEIRLKTQQTKHERLLTLLEKADNMENIIALENALSEVEYEIERLTGTLRKYDSLVGYATVTLRLNEVLKITEQPKETASLAGRVANAFSGGFTSFGRGLGDLAVWGAYHFIGIVVFVAAAGVAVAVVSKRYRKAKSKPPEEK